MVTINPYLNFEGNTEEAFNFYKSVFGGEFSSLVRFKDMPHGAKLGPAEANMLMHIALPIGKSNLLMGTDALESMGHKIRPGDNFSLSLNTDNQAEADKVFAGLSQGAKISMPMGKAPWGAYFGMLTDRYGIQWMVSYDENR